MSHPIDQLLEQARSNVGQLSDLAARLAPEGQPMRPNDWNGFMPATDTPAAPAGDAPTGLQLDLLTVIMRLRQLRNEEAVLLIGNSVVFDRLFTCDLPRLEGYLTPETRAWAERIGETG